MIVLRAVALILVCAVAPLPAVAQGQRPLLVEGTNTVFQRVLTRPAASRYGAPGGIVLDTYAAFQPLYVFARDGEWLQVGPSALAAPDAWVAEAQVLPWKQNIVGAFTNAAGRKRQLLFDSEDSLRWLLNHEAMRDVQDRLLAEADAGLGAGEDGVVSAEPAEFVNIREELYLMPILDFVEDLHPVNYEEILLLELASIPKDAEAPAPETAEPADPFDVGIVFVFDTTQSMDRYIALTQQVLQNAVRSIGNTDIGKLVNFGVIGFRDNVDAVPALEYRTRILMPLQRREDQTPVLAAIGEATQVARASSPGFNEDSLAGIEDAIDIIDWDQRESGDDPINARYVILVTDAGPKDPRDPNARSEIGVAELQTDAEGRGIALMTLHLKTALGGEANHIYASSRYRTLSRFAENEFYFPIENGSEEAFASVASRLVTAITDHVRVARGEAAEQSPDEVDEKLVEVGLAMQLAWLGTQRGTRAPDVIRGWLTDKAVEAPSKLAVEPRLLLTKNEMATMAELLDNLISVTDRPLDCGDPELFFGQVRAVVADMAQNPDRVVNADADTLGGALEYLEQLPYRSQLLQMTPNRWCESAMMRREIIDGMYQKLAQYRKWLYDERVWTALYDDAPDGEHVFAMPFDVLP